jgi:predicted MFS family arabinose efflux permease
MHSAHAFDSPRAAILGVFLAFGAAVGLWSGAVPVIVRGAGVDETSFGLGLAVYTLTYVLTMFFGGGLARFATNRVILLWSLPATALAGFALFLAASPVTLFASLIAFGAVLGLTDLFMNAEGSYIEADMKRPIFTAFHACASLGIGLFALVGSLMSVRFGMPAVVLFLIAAIGAAWLLVWRSLPHRRLAMARTGGLAPLPHFTALVLLGLAAGLVIAGETASVLWSASLLNDLAPSLAEIAGLAAAFFGMCTAGVRFAGDTVRARIGDIPLMIASLAVAIVGFTLVGLSSDFALSVAAFALVGFGTACVIPSIFALSAAYVAANRAAGIGFVSLIAGVPRTLAPWIFGYISEHRTISFAFGLCAISYATALVLILVLRRLRT